MRADNSTADKYIRRLCVRPNEFDIPYILQIFGNVIVFKVKNR